MQPYIGKPVCRISYRVRANAESIAGHVVQTDIADPVRRLHDTLSVRFHHHI